VSNPKPCHAQVSDSFPFKWINKKWKEGFYVTSMATSHTRWAVVMSRNAGYIDQVRPAAAHRACWLLAAPRAQASAAPVARICTSRCTSQLV
jgi:hypothetical protein